jgi:lipopolysaccharide/colanic/teichoic acid biosynthesis glycosyltransferase
MLEYRNESVFLKPYPWWKRLIDMSGALVALALFLPVMGIAALAIKWTSPGPVFFCQKRGGHGGKPFTVYKFRTMCIDAEARKAELLQFNERSGVAFKMKRDPRVTRVGQILRKTSIDELPQLFNVVKGDMSLVGPRPLPIDEEKAYEFWHYRRLDVKPGLTGLWQVSSRDDSDFDKWVRLDIEYIQKHSFFFDIWLLLKTIPAVLFRRGAS